MQSLSTNFFLAAFPFSIPDASHLRCMPIWCPRFSPCVEIRKRKQKQSRAWKHRYMRREDEQFEEALVTTAKENRSLKRQLALLEGGTSSALSELARERDEAVDATSEIKRRLEAAQKKIRSQEEDSDRSHELWAKDKDNWEEEKRKLERKIHVAEGRLKTILEEVAAYQANHQNGQQQPESEAEELSRESIHGHGSDTAS